MSPQAHFCALILHLVERLWEDLEPSGRGDLANHSKPPGASLPRLNLAPGFSLTLFSAQTQQAHPLPQISTNPRTEFLSRVPRHDGWKVLKLLPPSSCAGSLVAMA